MTSLTFYGVDKIKAVYSCVKCEECKLRDKNSNVDFAFYNKNCDQKLMLVLQNPGIEKGTKKELRALEHDLIAAADFQTLLELHMYGMARWLFINNKEFSREFFKILKKPFTEEYFFGSYGLLELKDIVNDPSKIDKIKGFISQLFDDFYITDLVKCRTETQSLKWNKKCNHLKNCYDQFLKYELEAVQPDVIFVFGTRAWKHFFYETKSNNPLMIINPSPTKPDNIEKYRNVSKAHGILFESGLFEEKKIWIIPLGHFSQAIYNFYLRDSYHCYLKKAVSKLKKVGVDN